jgi:N-methylhydantoinase B/oxoprolinase/acetone carboxylase alpha subunit
MLFVRLDSDDLDKKLMEPIPDLTDFVEKAKSDLTAKIETNKRQATAIQKMINEANSDEDQKAFKSLLNSLKNSKETLESYLKEIQNSPQVLDKLEDKRAVEIMSQMNHEAAHALDMFLKQQAASNKGGKKTRAPSKSSRK